MVSDLLNERHTTHGSFADNARVGQRLRAFWRSQASWESMPEQQREALDHMAGKLSRIFSGQATFADHWADIAGYAELARQACPQPVQAPMSRGVVGHNGDYHFAVDN